MSDEKLLYTSVCKAENMTMTIARTSNDLGLLQGYIVTNVVKDIRDGVAEIEFFGTKAESVKIPESKTPFYAENKSPILQYFKFDHLPPHLQKASKPFCDMAHDIDAYVIPGPEKSAGLRKLLEAKDCIVRAGLKEAAE